MNANIGQLERHTQDRVVTLFQEQLGYAYYGNWQDRKNNSNIEEGYLSDWLLKQGVAEGLIKLAIRAFKQAAVMGDGKKLYQANKVVYGLLRYGLKVRLGQGEQSQTVRLIDWKNPLNNDFAIAQEVTVKGEHTKRPDIVLYVNGIALGVIELKRASVGVAEGIHQNLDNQKKIFIRDFFSTMQLVMAGNDSQGLRYGTVETEEKYYCHWKEENPAYQSSSEDRSQKYLSAFAEGSTHHLLDFDVLNFCNKTRFLDIIHNFMVFDKGSKKTCRHNQYFGIKAAQQRLKKNESGIIWHTQGSGKSLTMVWLAKWLHEQSGHNRVLIVTDRTELDEQIEGVFAGVDEDIYRSTSGADLVEKLNESTEWLLCSLVHKFARQQDNAATQDYIRALKATLPTNFINSLCLWMNATVPNRVNCMMPCKPSCPKRSLWVSQAHPSSKKTNKKALKSLARLFTPTNSMKP